MKKLNKWMKAMLALVIVLTLVIPTTAKAANATSLNIKEEATNVSLWQEGSFDYEFLPEGADDEAVTWTSADEKVVHVEQSGYYRAIAPGTTTLTATSASGLKDTVSVTVLEPLKWHGEKTETVIFNTKYVNRTFELSVDTTGTYEIFSESTTDPYMYLYDAEGQLIEHNDDYSEYQFKVTADLEAGKTYYMVLGNYNYGPCNISVTSSKQEIVQGVTFKEDSITLSYGDAIYLPEFVNSSEDVVFQSSDSSVVEIYPMNVAEGLKEGKVTITATAQSGATDTLEITVTKGNVLNLSEMQSVTLGDGYIGKTYAITVDETDTYVMKSKGDLDTYAILLDETENLLAENDDDTSNNFGILYNLEKGKVYYLLVSTFSVISQQNYELDVCETQVGIAKQTPATSVMTYLTEDTYLKKDGDTYYVLEGFELYPRVEFGDSIGAVSENYEFASDNQDVVFIDDVNGRIIAQKTGTAKLTVTTENGLKDTITIVVLTEDDLITGDMNLDGVVNSKDIQIISDIINGKIKLEGFYNQADVDGNNKVDEADMAALVSSVEIAQMPDTVKFAKGTELDTTGLQLKVTYVDGTVEIVTTGFTVSGYDATKIGEQTLTVAYAGKTVTYKVTVAEYVSPATGDTTTALLWMIVFVISVGAVVLTFKKRRTSI